MKLTLCSFRWSITHLIEIEYQIQFTNIPEKAVEDLDKEVYGLQVGQLVIIRIYTRAEEQTRVPPVYDLVVAELDEVGLIFLIAGGYEAVDLVYHVSI